MSKDDRDWFSPHSNPSPQPAQQPQAQPPQQPQRPVRPQPPAARPVMPRPRIGLHPDQQVWPPAPSEPVGSSTQPIPTIPSAGPLPPRPQFSPPPGFPPQGPPPQGPPPQGPPPQGPPPQGPSPQDPPVQGPPPRRRKRPVLLGVGAVAALIFGVGAPTADRFLFYKSGQPSPTLQVVARGQSGTHEHVTWQAAIENTATPADTKHNTPDKQWLKITVTRTANDAEGALLTAKPELTLKDRQGRVWRAQVFEDNSPTDPHEVGKPYTLIAAAVVPTVVSKEVELHLLPNTTYKMNTPTKDLMRVTDEDMAKTRLAYTFVFRQ